MGATPEQITEVASRGYDEVLSAGETLLSKGLLKEREEDGKVIWDFTHAKVRECIYESISLSKRQELHKKVAEVLNNAYSPQKWIRKTQHYALSPLHEIGAACHGT